VKPHAARIILIEAGPRLLAGFPEDLATYAAERLQRLGVTVWTGQAVEAIEAERVKVAGAWVGAGTIVWAAGVQATRATSWIGGEHDRSGRIVVAPDLSIPGLERVYAIGDLAHCKDDDGAPLPALAQVANQQGLHLGRHLVASLTGNTPLPAFRFHNRGNTAIVGRHAAIFDFGWARMKGFTAWILWALIHVYLLIGFQNRLLVALQWLWLYVTYRRGARLILPVARREED
jgi:NADH dehydrogenase